MRVECWRVRLPQNPAKHPILIRPFNFQFLEFPPLKFRSYQADRQMPTWIVQGLDGNPVLVFPIFIAVCTVPSLQPFQVVRIHIISLPASTQLLINAVIVQVKYYFTSPVTRLTGVIKLLLTVVRYIMTLVEGMPIERLWW